MHFLYFARASARHQLTFAMFTVVSALVGAPAAMGQGMMEYGGLMAMPKGIPGGDTIKNMTRGFGTIPNALPGQTANGIPAGLSTTMPDGTVVVDPKKAKELSLRADTYYRQAKQLITTQGAQRPAALKQAEKLLRDTITIRNSIWGYADPTIPKLLNQLAAIYEIQKQPATAKSCYQNALVYINKKYGTGSIERLDTFVNLAPLLVKEGNLSEALSLEQQITLMKERRSGATDLGTIQARVTWAGTAKALDKPNAPDIYKQCLVDLDKAGSNISPEKVSQIKGEVIPSYVESLKKQGREDEAKEAAALLSSAAAAPLSAAPPAVSSPAAGAAAASTAATTANPAIAAPAVTAAPAASTTSTSSVAPTPAAAAAPAASVPDIAPLVTPEKGIKITPVSTGAPGH